MSGNASGAGGGAGVSAKVRHEMSGACRLVTGIVMGPPLTWPTSFWRDEVLVRYSVELQNQSMPQGSRR